MLLRSLFKMPWAAALRAALVALLTAGVMLQVDWVALPSLLGHAFGVPPGRPNATSVEDTYLAADLLTSLCVVVLLMRLAHTVAGPHGLVAPALMAIVGWWSYFHEVGYFQGMLHSENPWWYELLSFLKFWVAFGVAQLLWRGPNNALQRTVDTPTRGAARSLD
jgi:hypothetical protein